MLWLCNPCGDDAEVYFHKGQDPSPFLTEDDRHWVGVPVLTGWYFYDRVQDASRGPYQTQEDAQFAWGKFLSTIETRIVMPP